MFILKVEALPEYTTVTNIRNCKSLRIINTWGFLLLQKSSLYIECSDFIDSCLNDVLDRIKTHYSQKSNVNGIAPKEKWSEKYTQGTLIA